MVILTKFHQNWTKIDHFLLIAHFLASSHSPGEVCTISPMLKNDILWANTTYFPSNQFLSCLLLFKSKTMNLFLPWNQSIEDYAFTLLRWKAVFLSNGCTFFDKINNHKNTLNCYVTGHTGRVVIDETKENWKITWNQLVFTFLDCCAKDIGRNIYVPQKL